MSYVQRITFDGFVIWESGHKAFGWLEGETDTVEREVQFDRIGRSGLALYRQSMVGQRTYQLTVTLNFQTQALLQAALSEWRRVHQAGGERVLERVGASGQRFYLDCVPEEPQITFITPWTARVEQVYRSGSPFWRGGLNVINTAFNGVTPVMVTCHNTGDAFTWLEAVIVGMVASPVLTLPDGTEAGVNLTVGAGETLIIHAQPPATILLDNVNVYGYRTEDTDLNNFGLAVGDSDVTLTATSCVGTCALCWYTLLDGVR